MPHVQLNKPDRYICSDYGAVYFSGNLLHGGDSSTSTAMGYRAKLFVTISSSKARKPSGTKFVPRFFSKDLMSVIFKDALAQESLNAQEEKRDIEFDLTNKSFYCIENDKT